MKSGLLKLVFVLFTIVVLIFPSFSFSQLVTSKNFNLESVDWQISASNCDGWYDYATDDVFDFSGWEKISNATRIYGYASDKNSCKGDLKINNTTPGMYALFSYNVLTKKWKKIASTNQTLVYNISDKPITLVLAKATISSDNKTFGDFTIKNNLFNLTESVDANLASTTYNVIGSFNIGTSTATTTITWANALENYYQLLMVNERESKALPYKIDNSKNIASVDIGQQSQVLKLYVINVSKKNLGLATWYSYKKCDCAASRDFPKGTKLKVTNLYPGKNYGKSIVVKINDYGPMEYTGNLIDLDKIAFKKIANIGSGVVPVSIEVVK